MSSLQIVEINPGGNLLESVRNLDFLPGFNIEGFPNRDSTQYLDLYDINEAHTCIRGTIRYNVSICLLTFFFSLCLIFHIKICSLTLKKSYAVTHPLSHYIYISSRILILVVHSTPSNNNSNTMSAFLQSPT